jgi:hypothetical protein
MRTRIIVGGDGRCGSRHGTTEKLGQIWDGQLGGGGVASIWPMNRQLRQQEVESARVVYEPEVTNSR